MSELYFLLNSLGLFFVWEERAFRMHTLCTICARENRTFSSSAGASYEGAELQVEDEVANENT